ncbi:hypothetical protein BU24DRAFT_347388 [Aaosphaeria arxii CBS 175.79]|uniref:Zn(2)-C6 fungal-type domain-containing protein n=1 Tax=Aaosphaeria arxii CBS 175.79 TaxID=1450172 RepID=A0A6A5XT05_9PLEO|nr:uncharacterized protein BU24DRAFT_347388 [Aaosphaeria arxii CBS 175.79]KAF2016039.1 hypothetical protein BU24DRAFT_347388 [Aaosphaeria arxii CBS 175.79]
MSESYSHFYGYHDQPQVLISTSAFEQHQQYGHYEDNRRSKSPASLINQNGLSPGPLSTPPMSRNPSQPLEPVPDQMVWDNGVGSPSDSTSSLQTPDNESLDFEMLDSNDVTHSLQDHSSASMLGGQTIAGELPLLNDNLYFTDIGNIPRKLMITELQNAMNATLASNPHFNSFPSQLPHQEHTQLSQASMVPQHYGQIPSEAYMTQPSRQDPWSSQRTPHASAVPQPSGIAHFGSSSDPTLFDSFPSQNIPMWVSDTSDTSSLLSPNEPVVPPQDIFYPFPGQNFQSQNQPSLRLSPVEPLQTELSPSPDSGGFINYDPSSSFFTRQYDIAEQQPQSISPVTPAQVSYSASYVDRISRSSSNMGQSYPSSFLPAVSPQASAPSPGGSEGVFSYQQSESGLMMEPYPHEYIDTKPPQSHSPLMIEHSPFEKMSRAASNSSHDFDQGNPSRPQLVSKNSSSRPGGRALGTHLEPAVAKQAHDMRKITACWHCVLQRDKCGPGDSCERCLKRSQRPNADCGLGCSRIKLVELSQYFLPTLVTQIHEDAQLTHFVSRYIAQWGNQEITIHMTCGQKHMPRIPVKVYEFLPKGNELLVLIQYRTDTTTNKRIKVKKRSPALGMVHINHNEEKRYGQYISNIVDNHIDAFGELCWMEDDNDFQQKLFRLMSRLQPRGEDEAKLLREVMRLVVCTFIMSHTLTIAEETKLDSLSKMQSYQGPASYVENFTSPRMTNRQLKYFFNRIQRTILTTVLNKLQQIFKSSKGCDKWLAAFIAVVGMCMAHEDQQKTIHLVMETKAATENLDPRETQGKADIACREIDERMTFIAQIFRWKYNRKCNPLRDSERDWAKESGFSDPNAVTFIRAVAQLVKENIDFLQVRQNVSISSTNQTQYTSRLVGQFLLSFWLPQM